jgi:hypothetical protein
MVRRSVAMCFRALGHGSAWTKTIIPTYAAATEVGRGEVTLVTDKLCTAAPGTPQRRMG